jgi:hypothetical protein
LASFAGAQFHGRRAKFKHAVVKSVPLAACASQRARYKALMPLHLIKLCVGVDSLQDLKDWRASRAAAGYASICSTRMAPKRAAEILDGGSLYWVIRGQVLVRQAILKYGPVSPGRSPVI